MGAGRVTSESSGACAASDHTVAPDFVGSYVDVEKGICNVGRFKIMRGLFKDPAVKSLSRSTL